MINPHSTTQKTIKMKKAFILLAFVTVAVLSWVPPAHSIACAGPHPFKNGKCKSEVYNGERFYYCGSVLEGEVPNCAIYVQ